MGCWEFDVDFDGDADFDVSDVVSFKGFIHFFMGFGGWTSIKQLLGYEVTWIDRILYRSCICIYAVSFI